MERWPALKDRMPEPQATANGPAGHELVELTLICGFTEHQRQGYASRTLEMLTTLADENAVTIELIVRPYGPSEADIGRRERFEATWTQTSRLQ
jgi:hypothetical protein